MKRAAATHSSSHSHSNAAKKARSSVASKQAPPQATGMDFSKFKLLRVIPEREVDDEEEEEEFDEDEDLEVDYECQWLRRVRYDIVGPGRKIFGQLRFWYIDLDVIRDSFYAEMDIPSSECMEFAFSLFDKNGYLKRKFRHEGNRAWGPETDGSMLAYLHEIEIVESQRGKGIGTWALRQIWKVQEQEMVEGLEDINFLFAQPATLSNSADRDLRLNSTQAEFKAAHAPKQARVERFFRKVGFRRVGHTGWFCCARESDHPSKKIEASRDAAYKSLETPEEVRRGEAESTATWMQMRAQAGW